MKSRVREDRLFRTLKNLKGEELLVVTQSDQLNLFGQTFRPIFAGPLVEVKQGHITIYPITIKMVNAPFFKFPVPLSIPLEKIVHFTNEVDADEKFPLI